MSHECQTCGKTFGEKEIDAKHEKNSVKLLRCDICKETFKLPKPT